MKIPENEEDDNEKEIEADAIAKDSFFAQTIPIVR